MRKMAVLAVMLLAVIGGHAQADDATIGQCGGPGATNLVTTADDALRIAYAFHRATRPGYAGPDETTWTQDFTASLHGCVWEVAEKPKPPNTYSQDIMSIGAQDGRFLGILISD